MAEPFAKLQSLLTQARAADHTLAARFSALGALAQLLDRVFVAQKVDGGHALLTEDQATVTGGKGTEMCANCLLQEAAQVAQQILSLLSHQQVHLTPVEQLGEQQQAWLFAYFRQRIYPLLTPLAVDSGRPFPYISSDSLNLLILLHKPGNHQHHLYARVKVPRVVPRLINVPPLAQVDSPVLYNDSNCYYWVWSEEVVRFFVHELFAGMSVTGIYQFRVLRASMGREDADEEIEMRSPQQKLAPVVRLDVQKTMPPAVVHWLTARLGVPSHAVFTCDTPLRMKNLLDLAAHLERLPAQQRP